MDKIERFKVITLCGSTKFKDDFLKEEKRLTLEGNIVISTSVFGHSGDVISKSDEEMLVEIYKQKIDMCDELFVINKSGYIGEHTQGDINYAKSKGKIIKYMEPIEDKYIYCIEWFKMAGDVFSNTVDTNIEKTYIEAENDTKAREIGISYIIHDQNLYNFKDAIKLAEARICRICMVVGEYRKDRVITEEYINSRRNKINGSTKQ